MPDHQQGDACNGRNPAIASPESHVDDCFEELGNHLDAVADSWDRKFAILYELFKAQAEKTDKRFEELTTLVRSSNADLRAMIKLTYGSLDRRVTALEDVARRPGRRQR